jgi:hypothetical protein
VSCWKIHCRVGPGKAGIRRCAFRAAATISARLSALAVRALHHWARAPDNLHHMYPSSEPDKSEQLNLAPTAKGLGGSEQMVTLVREITGRQPVIIDPATL